MKIYLVVVSGSVKHEQFRISADAVNFHAFTQDNGRLQLLRESVPVAEFPLKNLLAVVEEGSQVGYSDRS
jgi:hypothetical protein